MWPLSSTIEFSQAAELAIALVLGVGFTDFLTIPGYAYLS